MEQMELDDIDLRLLEQLQQDASLSNLELAQRVFTSPPTRLRRVKRLREAGVIAPRREAQTVYYGISDPAAARLIALLCDIYRDKPKDQTP